MSFKSIDLKCNYESGKDDILEDFYIPVLCNSSSYDRIAGFFTSSSLAVAARGIAGLIQNSGKMRLIVSPRFSDDDIQVIESAINDPSQYIDTKLISEISNLTEGIERDHVYSLGWMIANQKLEMKIALVYKGTKLLNISEIEESGLFHQKVGVLNDLEGNLLSFSGSINETASGWLNNIEEFKTFKSWEQGQRDYCLGDQEKFNAFWNGERDNVKIVPLSEAVKTEFIRNAPPDPKDLLSIQRYRTERRSFKKSIDLGLFDFQKDAVNTWINNKMNLLLEMATGTGKTRTAIGCILKYLSSNPHSVIIIACPQNTLSLQWKDEVEKLGIPYDGSIIVDGTQPNWRANLEQNLLKIKTKIINSLVIFTTHDTASSIDFINLVQNNKGSTPYFFICDEVHGMGASLSRRGFLNCYETRLGLSATPSRWFDDVGTQLIIDYFGNLSFSFSISDALSKINPRTGKPFLVNFYYHPVFVSLTDDELEKYAKLSKQISRLSQIAKNKLEYLPLFENLVFKRANIQKSAINKYDALVKILDTLGKIQDTLIFVSPDQINRVMRILGSKTIIAHQFTEHESTIPEKKYGGRTERQYLIDKFKEGSYQVLVAIKCLDEGIDIPSASIAIIMASSTNPREYIQRVGRVIRQCEDKSFATIFDLIIKPDLTRYNNPEVSEFEKRVFKKEMVRVEEIAANAINNAEAISQVYEVLGDI